MSPRSFLIVVAVAVVALIAAIVVVVTDDSGSVTYAGVGDQAFPEFADRIDDLARMEIQTSRYELSLEQRDGEWVATNFGDYPVDPEPLLSIASELAAMTVIEPKTDREDWYQFINVVDPADDEEGLAIRVTATATNGDQLLDTIIGRPARSAGFTRFGGVFVRSVDDEQAWLVEGTVRAPDFIQDWFEQLFSVPGTDVASVTVLAGDEVLLSAEKVDFETADYELTFLSEELGPQESTAEDSEIRGVTQGIISTRFDRARALDTVTFADDARAVRFVTRDGMELLARLGEADGEIWVAYEVSAAEDSEAAALAEAIAARTDRWAFLIPSYRVGALNRPVETLFVAPEPPANDAPIGPLLGP